MDPRATWGFQRSVRRLESELRTAATSPERAHFEQTFEHPELGDTKISPILVIGLRAPASHGNEEHRPDLIALRSPGVRSTGLIVTAASSRACPVATR
ncbi:MAG: hypothetical protein JWP89_3436 [Schlesneria sp.]|nr:hypothetical protein [Schlesneria sp.]